MQQLFVLPEKEHVREKEAGHVLGGYVTGVFRGAHHCGGISGGWRKQGVNEVGFVDQDEGAAGSVGVEGKCISSSEKNHCPGRSNTRTKQSVPGRIRLVEELGALHCICKLRGSKAGAVRAVAEDRRIQERAARIDVRLRTTLAVDKTRMPSALRKIHDHGNNGSADERGLFAAIIIATFI